jgi:hypothetical protein
MWIAIVLLIIFLCYQCFTKENFDLSAAFVDLATYGSIDKYLYKSFIKTIDQKVAYTLQQNYQKE